MQLERAITKTADCAASILEAVFTERQLGMIGGRTTKSS
jgi:hypothetical protein